ncbi:MAG: hypothetical protein ACI4WU_00880 [Bacilli bacterium]
MKKSKGIIISILIILLVFVSTIAATYSVIINVVSNNGINEIVNVITIRDLMTDNDGVYNDTYYNVKNELDISDSEAEILMESDELNKSLQVVLNSIVTYKVDNDENAKMSDTELYNLIVDAVNKDSTISDELKDKVKNKSNIYIRDVSDFMYDIEVSVLENK